jgi:trigger factor
MNVVMSSAPRSTVRLEIEVPAEELDRAVNEAVRALSRRTRVPGFRPGKAPRAVLERHLGEGAVLEEAVEHLVDRSYREALVEHEILPLARAEIEMVQAEEGKPLVYRATVPVRPEVTLGDYRNFNFKPEIEVIDDARVDRVLDELRDQHATLAPVEDRAAQDGDYAVIAYASSRDGAPIEGGSADRVPLILGQERFIPGFEAHVVGLRPGESSEFELTFPADYPEESLAGTEADFHVELRELREKIPPPADDAFAASIGDYADLDALRSDIRQRLERNAVDRARHEFADRIIDYAVANATVELPDVLVDQEVEIMHDEFRSSLARQGITEEAYQKVTGKTADELHAEWRPRAERRARTLLVLTKIGEAEGIVVSDADVEVEVRRARVSYAGDARLVRYLESDRGRSFIRSTLRRSRTVEKLIDDWLAAHPEHPPLPHAEDAASGEVAVTAAEAAAAAEQDQPDRVAATAAS